MLTIDVVSVYQDGVKKRVSCWASMADGVDKVSLTIEVLQYLMVPTKSCVCSRVISTVAIKNDEGMIPIIVI